MLASPRVTEKGDLVLPDGIRALAVELRAADLECAALGRAVAAAWERDLRERGLPKGAMCRFRRHNSGKHGLKGVLDLDTEGMPVLEGFLVYVPLPAYVQTRADGSTVRRYPSRQQRMYQGDAIRSIRVAQLALAELEAAVGIEGPLQEVARRLQDEEIAATQTTCDGTPLIETPKPFIPPEERTLAKLRQRMATGLPVTSTSIAIVYRFGVFIDRVLPGDTRYDLVPRDGWKTTYAETFKQEKLVGRTQRLPKRDSEGNTSLISVDYVNMLWDAVCKALDFAVDVEGSLEYNHAKTVERVRDVTRSTRAPRPHDILESRCVERVAEALSDLAHDAVRDGASFNLPLPWRGAHPSADEWVYHGHRLLLPNGYEAHLEFGVAAVAGVPLIRLAGGLFYPAAGLAALVSVLDENAPRSSELLAAPEWALQPEDHRIEWVQRRVSESGRAVLAGRSIPTIMPGTKGTKMGHNPITRGQKLREDGWETLTEWNSERLILFANTAWKNREAVQRQLLFPGTRGGALSRSVATRLVYAVQDMAGVHRCWLHRTRHGLHGIHALTGVDPADSAAQLGHTVTTAERYYRIATADGEDMAVEAADLVRYLADKGLSHAQIRAYLRGRVSPVLDPNVISANPRLLQARLVS